MANYSKVLNCHIGLNKDIDVNISKKFINV